MGIIQNGKKQVYGSTGSLFGNITASLNISYDLLDSVDSYWGNLKDDGNFTGPLGMLQRNEVDVAVGPFSLKVDYLRYFYTAEAHIYEGVPILSGLRKPYLTEAFSSTDSFEPMAMVLLFMSMVTLVLISALSMPHSAGRLPTRLGTLFWMYSESLLMKSTDTSRLKTLASRTMFAAWLLCTFIVGQYITGEVKAALMIRSPAPRIDTLEELLSRQPPMRPLTLKATPFMNMLQYSGLDSYRALYERIVRMRGEVSQMTIYSMPTLREVAAGRAALMMDATGNRVFVAPHCDELQPAFFHMSRQNIETADFRWYMNRRLDPQLIAAMDRRIRWLLEAAVPFMQPHEVFRTPATCFLDQQQRGTSSGDSSASGGATGGSGLYEVLHLEDLRSAFLLLLCSLAVAFAVLLAECAVHSVSKRTSR
ncbi:glutamate receptor U1-like [Haemaphysalis longicornis]